MNDKDLVKSHSGTLGVVQMGQKKLKYKRTPAVDVFGEQQKLVEHQIADMEKRLQHLRDDRSAVIVLETTGDIGNLARIMLEEIIREVQVFANGEGRDLLLGSTDSHGFYNNENRGE